MENFGKAIGGKVCGANVQARSFLQMDGVRDHRDKRRLLQTEIHTQVRDAQWIQLRPRRRPVQRIGQRICIRLEFTGEYQRCVGCFHFIPEAG